MSCLVDMMGQVQKLKSGVGVQSLLDEACKILGNPIFMFNTEYSLLAYTRFVSDDPISNELVAHGTFSMETQMLFESEGFIEEVANASRCVLLSSENIKYDRIVGKIFNKNNSYVSNLVIVASSKPFGESDFMVFDVVCKLISKEISLNSFYQEYEQTHQEKVIRNLIDGNYEKKLEIAQVQILYDSLESSLYIAVADISGCEHNAVYFRDLFKQQEPAYKYAVYDNYIIIIISAKDTVSNMKRKLKKLVEIIEQNNIYIGVSSQFENLFEFRKHYLEAMKALQCVQECKSAQFIFPCHPSSMKKMARIKALENGTGIQCFLNYGAKIFGNPLLFHDMELNLLAYTEDAEIIDPIWEELITYGTSSDETINLFKTEGFVNTMDNTKGGAILVSKKIKYDRISWRIYSSDNIMIGCLSTVNTEKSFSEDELVLFGAFSQKFSKEVEEIEFYSNYGRVYSETVINRLISGKIDDCTFYTEDIGNIYDSLMEHLYLVVVDTAQPEAEPINLTCFRSLFARLDTVTRYAIYDNYIVIIISTDSASLNKNNELSEIGKLFEQNKIYAGISTCFDNIYNLKKYYVEAVQALQTGMKNKGPDGRQWLFQYDKKA